MFVTVAVPIVAVAWFGVYIATATLETQTGAVLRAASNGAEAQIREFMLHLKEETLRLSADPRVRQIAESPEQPNARSTAGILNSLRESFPEAREVFVLNTEGRIIASSQSEKVGTDQSAEGYFLKGQKAFDGGVVARRPNGELTWVMSAPIRNDGDGSVSGVLAARFDPEVLSDLTSGRRVLREGADTQSFRIGETGETYIVNLDGLMITDSRYVPGAVLRVKVDTLPVRTYRIKGEEMTGDYFDYRGVFVSGSSIALRDRGWIVLTEIDFRQAFAPIKRLRNVLVGLTLGLTLAGVLLAGAWARSIVQPLRMAGQADTALAAGDQVHALASEENLPRNEIGDFVRRRNDRVKALMERQHELVHEQKRSADAAAQLEQIAYSIVHDMRAPLRAIINFGDLLKEDVDSNFSLEANGYLARMRGAAARMDRLISDMLSYSSQLRGELPLHPVDVRRLLEAVIETYPSLRIHKDNIRLSPDLPVVRGNEAALTQCFSSLLDNAVKFTKIGQAPRINVTAEAREGVARIFVEDDGIGIAPHLTERLFGIFQRGSNDHEGTGIGLAMVRIAVTRMGGRVGVISEEGTGSRFWIELTLAV